MGWLASGRIKIRICLPDSKNFALHHVIIQFSLRCHSGPVEGKTGQEEKARGQTVGHLGPSWMLRGFMSGELTYGPPPPTSYQLEAYLALIVHTWELETSKFQLCVYVCSPTTSGLSFSVCEMELPRHDEGIPRGTHCGREGCAVLCV